MLEVKLVNAKQMYILSGFTSLHASYISCGDILSTISDYWSTLVIFCAERQIFR